MGHILAHLLSRSKSKRSQFIHSNISDYSETKLHIKASILFSTKSNKVPIQEETWKKRKCILLSERLRSLHSEHMIQQHDILKRTKLKRVKRSLFLRNWGCGRSEEAENRGLLGQNYSVKILYAIIMMDMCHYLFVQIQRMCTPRVECDVM